MKYFFNKIIFLGLFMLLVACRQATTSIPSSSNSLDATLTPTLISTPSQTPTTKIKPTSTPTHFIPTFLPTIDPKLVPDLLRKAISVQTVDGINGHDIKKITGWEHGFRQKPCEGYQWLDSSHLLLYPLTGQDMLRSFADASEVADLSSKAVVIDLTHGTFWLLSPPSQTDYLDCNLVYWSRELSIIVNREYSGSTYGPTSATVVIYSFDGDKIAEYKGILNSISPSGENFLVGNDTIVNLRNNKTTKLTWHIYRDRDYNLGILPNLYWSSDETQVYRCCFYYANLNTGKSYSFEWSDLRGPDGKPLPLPMNPYHTGGQWVRNDTYFFPTWGYMSYAGDPIGMFSPTTKKYYFIERSDTPPIDPETLTYTFSPDGMYVWMRGVNSGYGTAYGFLSNLTTLETTSYDIDTSEFEWSPDSKFACLRNSPGNSSFPLQINLLSVADKKLEPLNLHTCPSWRPNDHLVAYLTEENQVLVILNPEDMSVKGWKLPAAFSGLIWSPDGGQLILIAEDGSFWHVDYPKLDNFEQLTQPMSMKSVSNITWSPDSKSIAFISRSDIYIVQANK